MTRKNFDFILRGYPFFALMVLPLVLLLFNDAWSWDSTEFFDNHVYVGFFRHYLEFKYPFVENYKSSRLPFLLPGVLLYRMLPDAVAHHAIFFLFLIGAAALLFVWARERFGPHAAWVVAAAHSAFMYSHTGPSYHNQAASAYFILSLVVLDLPKRFSSTTRIGIASGVMAMAMTTDTIVAALAPVFGLNALYAVPRPWTLRGVLRHAAWAVCGAVSAIVALGLINMALGGPFLFFVDQIKASMLLAQQKALSRVPLSGFLSVWKFPWLTLPAFTAMGAIVLLAIRARRRPFDQAALAAVGFLLAMAAAALMNARGLGILEFPHLFHPFFSPMFLALAALVGQCREKDNVNEGLTLAGSFLVLTLTAMIVPLSLFGAWCSELFLRIGRSAPILGNGSLVAFAILAMAVAASIWLRRSARVVPLVAAVAFGLVNVINAPATQPGYLYAVQSRCSFRRDFYSALLEADVIFHKFDDNGQARWTHPYARIDRPQFDGKTWCRLLPLETVPRDILLSKYFYTTAQFANGFKMPSPLRKLVIAAPNAAQATNLLASFRFKNGPNLHYTESFSHVISRPTFSLVLRGYDIAN